MNFDFSPEQYALRDLARELFEKESPPSRLREVWASEEPRSRDVWKTLASVGFLEIDDPVDLALVLEEAGRAALPEPLVETVAIARPVGFASDDALVTVVDDGYAVDADDADSIVGVPDVGFVARRVASIDPGRRLFAIDGGASPPGTRTRGAAATANVLNGVAMRMLETTVAYVKARHQFGRPVGSFQAVKHKLASVHVALESSRAAAWYAAYAISREQPDAQVAASAAKVCACEAEALANREALQCHGGIGFTWEHDLHLWLKRGKALESAYGSAAWHRAALAAELVRDA
jgi:alkylation response protein AidB-like acyl-CoA dehydrogenase